MSRAREAMGKNAFNDFSDCVANSWMNKRRGPTNPRYKRFDQVVFTSADESQVWRHVVLNALLLRADPAAEARGVDAAVMTKTIKYFFYKLKKGIYVSFRGGRLAAFEPFSNVNYVNDFYDRMWTTAGDRRDLAALRRLQEVIERSWPAVRPADLAAWGALGARAARRFRGVDRRKIVANGCLPRFSDFYEGEHGTSVYLDMLSRLEGVPDRDFILHLRDFPVAARDDLQPYPLYSGERRSREYRGTLAPVLGYTAADGFDDICIPTYEDWASLTQSFYPSEDCKRPPEPTPPGAAPDWDSRRETCVFRGSATGCSVVAAAVRARAAAITDADDLLDIEVTDWNARPRLRADASGRVSLDVRDARERAALEPGPRMDYADQARFKYMLHADGHSAAVRLGTTLRLGCCMIVLRSPEGRRVYLQELMRPWEHFVPLESVEDLPDTVRWLRAHDAEARRIAAAGASLAASMDRRGVLDALRAKIAALPPPARLAPAGAAAGAGGSRGVVIVPYRDTPDGSRADQRALFERYMRAAAPGLRVDFVEQAAGRAFNRGLLLNVGAARNRDAAYFVLHDVDHLPDLDLLALYGCPPSAEPVTMLAARGSRWSPPAPSELLGLVDPRAAARATSARPGRVRLFAGAALAVRRDAFEAANGFPNDLYGWGVEDDLLVSRLWDSGVRRVRVPARGALIDTEGETPIAVTDKLRALPDDGPRRSAWELAVRDDDTWRSNGLAQVAGAHALGDAGAVVPTCDVSSARGGRDVERRAKDIGKRKRYFAFSVVDA